MEISRSRRGLVLIGGCIAVASIAGTVIALSRPAEQVRATTAITLGAAQVLIDQGDLEGAELILRRLEGVEVKLALGKLLAQRGRWREARPILLEALSDHAHRTECLRLLAHGSLQHRDWEGAKGFLLELSQADPKDFRVLKALAVCQKSAGEPLAALATAQRALALEPSDAELVALMGEAAEESVRSAALPGRRPSPHFPEPLRYGRRTR